MDFGDFIRAHDADDLGHLALSRERYRADVEDFDLALNTLEARRKLRGKVPGWVAVPSLKYPFRLSAEQCSSAETARYKASVAMAACSGTALADLTGGLGVDSWAFAEVFSRVLYNEMKPELARAAEHNFRELGVTNIVVRNHILGPAPAPSDSVSSPALSVREVLGDFCPDIIFLDPARRASDGRKVFRLEDCQPAVLQLLPELLDACPLVLLKLSPMADITLVCKQLGCVKQVHVVASGGECKELLLLLERGFEGEESLKVYDSGTVAEIDKFYRIGDDISPWIKDSFGCIGGKWLFEPGKALLKAGAFTWPCRFGVAPIGRHTHMFMAKEPVPELTPFGKWFRLLEVVPLSRRSFKELGKHYPLAEVTARNIPMTSDQLRARLGCRSGGVVHIFGLHDDCAMADFLYVCTREACNVSGKEGETHGTRR